MHLLSRRCHDACGRWPALGATKQGPQLCQSMLRSDLASTSYRLKCSHQTRSGISIEPDSRVWTLYAPSLFDYRHRAVGLQAADEVFVLHASGASPLSPLPQSCWRSPWLPKHGRRHHVRVRLLGAGFFLSSPSTRARASHGIDVDKAAQQPVHVSCVAERYTT